MNATIDSDHRVLVLDRICRRQRIELTKTECMIIILIDRIYRAWPMPRTPEGETLPKDPQSYNLPREFGPGNYFCFFPL
ncbi:MAG TPA: hypothetical protein VGG79_23535 [Roseiarcus sp.]|jgi:hypothetical protein